MVTAVIQGQIGVGLRAFGTPILLIMGVDYLETMSILLPCSLALSFLQVIEGRDFLRQANKRDFLLLLPSTAAGFILWYLFKSQLAMKPLVGIVMLTTSILVNHKKFSFILEDYLQRFSRSSLVTIGLIHGLTNMGGSLLTLLSAAKFQKKRDIRSFVALGYMLMAIVQISVAKLSNPNDFNIELNYVVIALFGYLVIGKSLFTRFDDRAYKFTVQFCVVVLAAISLIF